MLFLNGYMDNTQYRHALNEMTQNIFHFSFEDWYKAGYFEGEYIPYSYFENGKIIANASANIMKIVQNNAEKLYIQIGTVMTRPQYRNRGLAAELISKIIRDYQAIADGFYLFANLNALGFYERQGFQRLDQWRYKQYIINSEIIPEHFVCAGEKDMERYKQLLRNGVLNTRLDQKNRASLQLFYTGKLENVYYYRKLDCFTVMHTQDRTLYLDSVISSAKIPLAEVLKHIAFPYNTVILGFTPEADDAEAYIAEQYDGESNYRFYYLGKSLEAIAEDKLFFPVMTHA